jgi:hypothetical protein
MMPEKPTVEFSKQTDKIRPIHNYPSKQWAAVRIHWRPMMDPPHRWFRDVSFTCRLTCQGHSPKEEFVPPTMRRFVFVAQTEKSVAANGQK